MFGKSIKSILLSLLVLLLTNDSRLDQLSDEQSRETTTTTVASFVEANVDSVPKSDHNFYSPQRNTTTASSNTGSEGKFSKTCSHSDLKTILQFPQSSQCSRPEAKIQNVTLDSSIKHPLSTQEGDKLKNISTQEESGNLSKSSDSLVNDIIMIKSSPVSTQDMLSFEEWRRKISEQMERSKIIVNQPHQVDSKDQPRKETNGNGQNLQLPTNRARNFASYECGSKITAFNSEADFVNRVLNEQQDEYMLNPCKTKNWFVIELCETIQPQYFEIANYELYSSVPKEFAVFASENYPNRNDWSLLGSFTANDVRTVQGFKLQNNGFVKYLKVELHSYYGSEHFCPISLIRVFGTSLFDEVERIDKPEAKTIEYSVGEGENALFEDSLNQQSGIDILGNAKKAVYNIVMKAFNFDIFNRILENFSLKKPKTTIDIHQQSELIKLYHNFEPILSRCENYFFTKLHTNSSIRILNQCLFFRFTFNKQMFDMFLTQYFIRKYINNQLFLQCSINGTLDFNETSLKTTASGTSNSCERPNTAATLTNLSLLSNNSTAAAAANQHTQRLSNLIDKLNTSLVSNFASNSQLMSNITLEPSLIEPTLIKTVLSTLQPSITASLTESISAITTNETVPSQSSPEVKLESVQPPMVEFDSEVQSLSSSSGQSKEAVIIRLTNRIKNLEKNISLMSTYLENLSVRYRKQMEEMQSIFNKTINHLNNTAIRAAEKDLKQQEFIVALEDELTDLKQKLYSVSTEVNTTNWLYIQIHLLLMLCELALVSILCFIFYVVFRRYYRLVRFDNTPTANVVSKNCDNLLVATTSTTTTFLTRISHRSKSMSDLVSGSPRNARSNSCCGEPQNTPVVENTDCDNTGSDKENHFSSLAESDQPNSNHIKLPLNGLSGQPLSTNQILKVIN